MVRQRSLTALALELGLAALGGCGSARPTAAGEEGTTCTTCHGYPPAVGAHAVHVNADKTAFLGKQFGCEQCHKNVQRVDEPDHIVRADGTPVPAPAEVRFDDPGALAPKVQPGVVPPGQPAYAYDTDTCSNVYCHGATLKGQQGLPLNTAPKWGKSGAVDQPTGCGTCHGIPPSDHPTNVQSATQCVQCHAGAIDTSGVPNPVTHVNGQVEVVGSNTNDCSACHGDKSVKNAGPGDPASAPPTDAEGNPNSKAVGAHQAHVRAGQFAPAISCGECHPVPTSVLQPGHIDGQVTVQFGGLAKANPSIPPYTPAPAPQYDFTAQTCGTTYCHGSFAGGTPTNPTWTAPAGTVVCGSCHGLPPPAPVHPSTDTTDCGGCHGSGYHVSFVGGVADPTTATVDLNLHVNGKIDRQ